MIIGGRNSWQEMNLLPEYMCWIPDLGIAPLILKLAPLGIVTGHNDMSRAEAPGIFRQAGHHLQTLYHCLIIRWMEEIVERWLVGLRSCQNTRMSDDVGIPKGCQQVFRLIDGFAVDADQSLITTGGIK